MPYLVVIIIITFCIFLYIELNTGGRDDDDDMNGGTNMDFDSMSLAELNNQLSDHLNKGECITLWGRGRENEKLILNTEKVPSQILGS